MKYEILLLIYVIRTYLSSPLTRSVRMNDMDNLMGCNSRTSKYRS